MNNKTKLSSIGTTGMMRTLLLHHVIRIIQVTMITTFTTTTTIPMTMMTGAAEAFAMTVPSPLHNKRVVVSSVPTKRKRRITISYRLTAASNYLLRSSDNDNNNNERSSDNITDDRIIIPTARDDQVDGEGKEEDDDSGLTGMIGDTMNNLLMKDTRDLMVNDWFVAKRDIPSLRIRSGAVYKIIDMYLKGGGGGSDGLGIDIVPLKRYGDDENGKHYPSSYTKYLRVYNPRDHDNPNDDEFRIISEKTDSNENNNDEEKKKNKGVVVTPEEIGLVSVKDDWTEALYLAVPGFFWVFVAMAFSNYYTDRYGGNFWDAFFRT